MYLSPNSARWSIFGINCIVLNSACQLRSLIDPVEFGQCIRKKFCADNSSDTYCIDRKFIMHPELEKHLAIN